METEKCVSVKTESDTYAEIKKDVYEDLMEEAVAWAESIRDLLRKYDSANKVNNEEPDDTEESGNEVEEEDSNLDEELDPDAIYEEILSTPLSVEYRASEWQEGNANEIKPTEYRILLGWGGPSACIMGKLDNNNAPSTAGLYVQGWYTPWIKYTGSAITEDKLRRFARFFIIDE